MDRPSAVAVFLLGATTGSALTYALAVAAERFRRILREFRVTRRAVKTLRRLLVRQAGHLAVVALVVAVLGGVIVAVLTR